MRRQRVRLELVALVALVALLGAAVLLGGASTAAACADGGGCCAREEADPAPTSPDGACSGGSCPDGCAHCHLPCCAGLVFTPGTSAPPTPTLAAPRPCFVPPAAPPPGRLATLDLDRPPRA